ncbi:hypothetical protein BDV29DRAFT_70429 [Aspergillus leporis]|uniref:Uncharacterized protein n=1 Tax=Aspergillus leporis TaxID=41062 RepID=A0A5N5WM66_9EURO|nr:hypothetical protein BDV29DRAFT_70429 [Aspergillus leporis]
MSFDETLGNSFCINLSTSLGGASSGHRFSFHHEAAIFEVSIMCLGYSVGWLFCYFPPPPPFFFIIFSFIHFYYIFSSFVLFYFFFSIDSCSFMWVC